MRIRIVPAALIGSILALGGSVPAAAEISDDKIRNLSIGMKKEDVLAVLGKPDSMYADGLNAEGKPVEMLEYRVAGMMDFPDEGYTVDPRMLGKTYGIDRPKPPPKHKGSKGYDCTLVLIDGTLGRVEKRR